MLAKKYWQRDSLSGKWKHVLRYLAKAAENMAARLGGKNMQVHEDAFWFSSGQNAVFGSGVAVASLVPDGSVKEC